MSREELIKILEDYEIFVDDDFGGSYKSIIAYTPDKKVSRAHTPIGTLKIIDTFEEIQNQNKEYKEVIDKAIEYIESNPLVIIGDYDYFVNDLLQMEEDSKKMSFIRTLLEILKEVE